MPSKRVRARESFEPELPSVAEFDFGRSQLLETGSFSDFTISSRGVNMKVHRACLTGVSPYFDGIINSGLSESLTQHCSLHEESPGAIFLVIWYIYTHTYPAMEHSTLKWNPTLESAFLRAAPTVMTEYKSHLFLPHLEVMKLADMMMLPKLKEIAFAELRSQLLGFPKHNNPFDKGGGNNKIVWSELPDFREAIEMVYSSDTCALSELQKFFAWLSIYNAWKWVSGQRGFEELVLKFPSFGWNLYMERDELGPQNLVPCDNCHKEEAAFPNTIVYELDSSFKVIVCKCWYRGFCMEGCQGMSEGFADIVPTYCNRCSTGSRKTWDLNYVKRCSQGLQLVEDGSHCRLTGRNHYARIAPAPTI